MKVSKQNDLIIWEGVTGKEVVRLPVGPANFSSHEIWADGRSLIVLDEHSIKLWDLDSQQVRFQLSLDYESAGIKEHFRIGQALLLPGNRHLLTQLADGSALVWDLAPAFPSSQHMAEMPADKELRAHWAALASEDGRLAYKAVWRLEELPKQRRLEQLLAKWPANTMSPLALRRFATLQILEYANTAESRRALADLSKNPFSETERDQAQAALGRLEKRSKGQQ